VPVRPLLPGQRKSKIPRKPCRPVVEDAEHSRFVIGRLLPGRRSALIFDEIRLQLEHGTRRGQIGSGGVGAFRPPYFFEIPSDLPDVSS